MKQRTVSLKLNINYQICIKLTYFIEQSPIDVIPSNIFIKIAIFLKKSFSFAVTF